MNSSPSTQLLIPPYGGSLVDLLVTSEERQNSLRKAVELPSIQLSPRSLCDLELLATGAFSPLNRFMGRADYERVLGESKLSNGTFFPMPVTLPVHEASKIAEGEELALRSDKNELIATMLVEEIFPWDVATEGGQVCGTADPSHPLVAEMSSWGKVCVSGPLKVLNLPQHRDFPGLRRSPAAVRALLEEMSRANVVALQTRDPILRDEEEFVLRTLEHTAANLILNLPVGLYTPGDMDHYARVRACLALCEHYFDVSRTLVNLFPLAPRPAGAREGAWHAIIQRNFGANRLFVQSNEVGAGETLAAVRDRTGVELVSPDEGTISPEGRGREEPLAALKSGRNLPERAMRPEVAAELSSAHRPLREQGFCVWFTGLPSAGKSTIADILAVRLMEHGRQVTVLDGDVVRTHLSKGLGFSKQDRDTNILRIGFVASEIARHHGAVICAAVSPYHATREQVRGMVGQERFVLIYVSTTVEECEHRDVKGLYARARAGELKGFTGVDDPYEPPTTPDLALATTDCTPEESAERIVGLLKERGFLAEDLRLARPPGHGTGQGQRD